MPDNNFNELLIHNLKQIHIRLDRLEAKVDEKVDKEDLKAIEQRFDNVENRLDNVESRLDRIESGIGTDQMGDWRWISRHRRSHGGFKNVLMCPFRQQFLK